VNNSYLLNPASQGGFSGAPIYYCVNKKVYFAGIVLGHYPNNNITIAVKPEEVLNLLDK
jgi:hypothetical protein